MDEIIGKYGTNELSLKERIRIKNRRQYLKRKESGKVPLKNINLSKDDKMPPPTGYKGRPQGKYLKDEVIKLIQENQRLKKELEINKN